MNKSHCESCGEFISIEEDSYYNEETGLSECEKCLNKGTVNRSCTN